MAHYAYLDENNVVIDIIVGKDENELINGLDPEIYYAQGTSYNVKRASYNGKIRKQYPGIGYIYLADGDVFITPQPFPSWILDSNYDWQAPKPKPGVNYEWDELQGEWIEVDPLP